MKCQRLVRFGYLASLLFLVACAEANAPATATDAAVDSNADDTAADAAIDSAADDTTAADDTAPDGSAADAGDADTALPGAAGAPCTIGSDCDSSECLPISTAGNGICVVRCASTDDCTGDERCVAIDGTDAISVCVSATTCIDLDNDGAGIGPGCSFPDCDDNNAAVQPAAREICNGIDDNCNLLVDESVVEVGDACSTGFSGQCADGQMICDGDLRCQQLRLPADEQCNDLDDDCDGETDE
ncbi:MAG: hypothetical protein HQ461_10630, partial [Deltaproteobacteria bacterium]|nr:hypothetical protein [Deltaproteobacteria bacterium]